MEFLIENSDNFIANNGSYVNQEGEVILSVDTLKEKGYAINDKGELIDPVTNTVLKSKNDFLTEYFNGTPGKPAPTPPAPAITFDSAKGYVKADGTPAFSTEELEGMKFNATGDLVDDKGTILKTAAEIVAWYSDSIEPEGNTTITEIEKITGLKVLDDSGKPVVFEDTLEGIAAYTSALVKQTETAIRANATAELFKSNPDIYEMLMYKQTYGSLQGFTDYVDYSKLTLDENNTEQLKDIVRQYQLSLDKSTDRTIAKANADRYVAYIEKEGLLKDTATANLKSLQDAQASDKANAAKLAKDRQDAQDKAVADYLASVDAKIIKNGKLSISSDFEFTIPERITVRRDGKIELLSRADFYNYFVVPKYTMNGEPWSQFDYDEAKLTNRLDLDLFRAYQLFTGVSEAELLQAKVKTEKVKDLKDFIGKNNSTPKKGIRSIFDIPNRGVASVNTNS